MLAKGICKEKRLSTYNIVMSDFNIVLDSKLDTNNIGRKMQGPGKRGKIPKNVVFEEWQLEEKVNEEWDKISKAISQAANTNIPFIKVKKTEAHFKRAVPKLKIYKEIGFLYQIIKDIKKLPEQKIDHKLQSSYNSEIFLMNMKYNTKIPLLKHEEYLLRLKNYKDWLKVLKKKAEIEQRKKKEEKIQQKIENRYG
ncbi:17006_t:CDS:2, partial [Gigaspora margarita]